MALTVKEVVRRLKYYRPLTVEDVLTMCGFTLRHLNWGQFRHVYELIGTNLVLKFPIIDENYNVNRRHGAEEYRHYQQILRSRRKYKQMQKYMPKLHLFQPRTGLTLMERYKSVPYKVYKNALKQMREDLKPLVADISPHNSGLDQRGNLKIIDLGLTCSKDDLA